MGILTKLITASTSADEYWMRRALRLALRGLALSSPNPSVGCIIVNNNQIIGQGVHHQCGGPHGERLALQNVRDRGHSTEGATVYVTLAPCTRHGRTPPCVDALIEAKVDRVVAAVSDPFQDEAGEILAQAGIAYETGCCEQLAKQLHGGFFTRQTLGRPRVTAKWAMTLDGHLACHNGHSSWLSHPAALSRSRRRRVFYDAIIVGAKTASIDRPRLLSNCKGDNRTPLRVIISAHAAIDPQQFDLEQAPVLVLHSAPGRDAAEALTTAGYDCQELANCHDPQQCLQALGDRGCNDVLLEGGAALHGAWLAAGVVDQLETYLCARSLGGGLPVSRDHGVDAVADGTAWEMLSAPRCFGDTVWTSYRRFTELELS